MTQGIPLYDLQEEELEKTRARGLLYNLLSVALEYPDDLFIESVATGNFQARLLQLAGVVCSREKTPLLDALGSYDGCDDITVEYNRLFEVGESTKAACPLAGGLYSDNRLDVMEEVVRFYNFFGLTTTFEDNNELPDSLSAELEFLGYLSGKEAELASEGKETTPYRIAQRDFISRHPGKWLPQLLRKMRKAGASEFYLALLTLIEALLAEQLAVLVEQHGPVPQGSGLPRYHSGETAAP